jgi:low affinity Fe/Cu permease
MRFQLALASRLNLHRSMHEIFRRAAHRVACVIGTPWAFVIALAGVVVWLASGPIFGFSDTWQLLVNTTTTIITFLVVFLIQNTQNHDSRALHLKIDELLRALAHARTDMVALEFLPDEELDRLEHEFQKLRQQRRHKAPHRHARG